MKAKKRNIRSRKSTLKGNDKRAGSVSEKKNTGMKQLQNKTFDPKKSRKKQKNLGVTEYCEACMIIRKGEYNWPRKGKYTPHTCKKTIRELNEFIYHINIMNGLRGGASEGNDYWDYI